MSVEVSLGAKLLQAEGRRGVGLHVDLTLLHSCTFLSFVTELVCALDHSSKAFAFAQDCHIIDLHLSLCVCHVSRADTTVREPSARKDREELRMCEKNI